MSTAYSASVLSARVSAATVVRLSCGNPELIRIEVRANPLDIIDGTLANRAASVFTTATQFNALSAAVTTVRQATVTVDNAGKVTQFDFI